MKPIPQGNCSNDAVQSSHDKVNVSVKVNGVVANAPIETNLRYHTLSIVLVND